MYRVIAAIILVSLFLGAGLTRPPQAAQTGAVPGLLVPANERGFFIGAAVSMNPFREEPEYREALSREFNVIVAENAFKFEKLRPAKDRYLFTDSDALVDFAEQNRMKVRGHTLVWHRQLPGWLTTGKWSRTQAIEILRQHIETVVGRYRGRIWAWDVVNEAIDDNQKDGLRRDSFWYRMIGPDYIAMAFRMAHEADPEAILYYNDFSNEGMGRRSDLVFRLLSDLKKQGVPVDGIGWQMHLQAGFRTTAEHRDNAQRLADIGLELSITELDVRVRMPPESDAQSQQALTYADVASFCLRQPSCRALVLWGFTDGHSWIPDAFPGEGDALPFDAAYQPKPAYASLKSALENAVAGAPRIIEAAIRGGTLVVEGENLDIGSVLIIDGITEKRAHAESGTISLNKVETLIGERKTLVLQIKNTDGKLSVARRFLVDNGTLDAIP